jgi:hypothetical protein
MTLWQNQNINLVGECLPERSLIRITSDSKRDARHNCNM